MGRSLLPRGAPTVGVTGTVAVGVALAGGVGVAALFESCFGVSGPDELFTQVAEDTGFDGGGFLALGAMVALSIAGPTARRQANWTFSSLSGALRITSATTAGMT